MSTSPVLKFSESRCLLYQAHIMSPRQREFILKVNKELFLEFGEVPEKRKEFLKAKRLLDKKHRHGSEFKDHQELFEVFKSITEDQSIKRNTQIIAKINLGEMSLILTQDLFQYVQIGDDLYDLNSRFYEFSRRIYDYCLVQSFLDYTPELGLFMKILDFKMQRLFATEKYKSPSQRKDTFLVHMAMDKAAGINAPLVKATEKFMKLYPKEVTRFISSSPNKDRNPQDFTDIPDSRCVRRRMKGVPFTNNGARKYLLKDARELLESEDEPPARQESVVRADSE